MPNTNQEITLTEEQRKKYQEGSKAFLKTLTGINYRSAYEFAIHTRNSFEKGCEYAHNDAQSERDKAWNEAIDASIKIVFGPNELHWPRPQLIIEELQKLKR